MTNSLPRNHRNAYVTGLEGYYISPRALKVGFGIKEENQQTLAKGKPTKWHVRWDFDEVKGPHVNVQIGKPYSNFAFKLDPSQYINGDPKLTMKSISDAMNKVANYEGPNLQGGNANFDKGGGWML